MSHPIDRRSRDRPPPDPAGRLAAHARSGNILDLWPGLTRTELALAHEELLAATRSVLAGTPGATLRLPPDVTPRAMGIAAFTMGIGPLVGSWAATRALGLPHDLQALFAMHLEHGRRRAVRLQTELGTVLEVFEERGIPVTLLKWAHTAPIYFPEPGARPASDLDLLVAPARRSDAEAALARLGFVPVDTAPSRSRSTWQREPLTQAIRSLEMTHADNPWSVDLHVGLEREYWPTHRSVGLPMPADALGAESGRGSAGRLPQPLALAYLAAHASAHLRGALVLRVVELVLMIRQDFRREDNWRALKNLLDHTGLAAFSFPALELAERLAHGTLDVRFRDWLRTRPPARMVRVVRATAKGFDLHLSPVSMDERLMWARNAGEVARGIARVAGAAVTRSPREVWALLRRLVTGRLTLHPPHR